MNLFQDNYTSVSYCLNDRYLELRRCNRYLKGKKITKSVINNSIKILGIPYTQAERKRLYSFIEKNKGKPFLIYLILHWKNIQEIYRTYESFSDSIPGISKFKEQQYNTAVAESRRFLNAPVIQKLLKKPPRLKP